jgi:hypothetical protein
MQNHYLFIVREYLLKKNQMKVILGDAYSHHRAGQLLRANRVPPACGQQRDFNRGWAARHLVGIQWLLVLTSVILYVTLGQASGSVVGP